MSKALDLLRFAVSFLRQHGIAGAEKEAEFILTKGAGIDRVSLYRDNPSLTGAQSRRVKTILRRRAKREPLQYILGHVEFYGLRINVGPGVLIPRPETEILVEEVLKNLKKKRAVRLLDVCTGSGCVALAIAKNLSRADVFGTDRSEKALRYAKRNAGANSIKNVTFLKGPLFEPVEGMCFDVIVSNPPYIKTSILQGLEPEIRDWEPEVALDGGEDGLTFYRRIFARLHLYLKPGGLVVVETPGDQAQEVAGMARASGLEPLWVIKDYAGHERVVKARQPVSM